MFVLFYLLHLQLTDHNLHQYHHLEFYGWSETFGEAADNAEQASLGNFLGNAIGRLEANERQVVLARWGLQNGPPLSRAEIADKLGVSREWVRQLERTALKKLKGQVDVQHAFDDYRQSGSW